MDALSWQKYCTNIRESRLAPAGRRSEIRIMESRFSDLAVNKIARGLRPESPSKLHIQSKTKSGQMLNLDNVPTNPLV